MAAIAAAMVGREGHWFQCRNDRREVLGDNSMSDAKKVREERDKRIRALAARGESTQTIARAVGVSRQTVARALGRVHQSR
jgi:DNA invertase Pin-like site-specific DNA recombinase